MHDEPHFLDARQRPNFAVGHGDRFFHVGALFQDRREIGHILELTADRQKGLSGRIADLFRVREIGVIDRIGPVSLIRHDQVFLLRILPRRQILPLDIDVRAVFQIVEHFHVVLVVGLRVFLRNDGVFLRALFRDDRFARILILIAEFIETLRRAAPSRASRERDEREQQAQHCYYKFFLHNFLL